MTLPQKTFIGAILGILAGILFGNYCAYLRPIGSLYVLLLQVAVYPYLISSLLRSLGSLVPKVALDLLRRGWVVYIVLLLLTFGVMYLLSNAIPVSPSSISVTQPAEKSIISTLLDLLVPSNPFAALSQNYVPAIIIFCVLYGVMLQHVTKKDALFETLDAITKASLEFWNKLVKVAPYAVFALFADAAGTINIAELRELSVYLVVFFVGTLSLAFWIIPSLLASLTSIRRRELLSELREGLLLSMSTTLSVVALPAIQQFTHKLISTDAISEEEEPTEVIRTVSSVSYAFAQLGNSFLYLFAIFSAFYFAHPLTGIENLLLPFMSYLSSIGSPSATINSIAFLADWLHLPPETTELYVETITLTRYGQVLASVMGIAALTILMTLAYYRKLNIQWRKLAINFILVVIVLGTFAYFANRAQTFIFNNAAANFNEFRLDTNLTSGIAVSFISNENAATPPGNEDTLARIQRTHVLRVGYNPNVIPFCYVNNHRELVGYDVAMVYALARTLQSRIEFIPFTWNTLIQNLQQNKFDLAIGGIYASQERLSEIGLTDPYFSSPLALIVPEKQKSDYAIINKQQLKNTLKVGIFDDPVLLSLARHYFPSAQIVVVPNYANLAELETQRQINVALWTKEQAEAWVMLHPGFAAIVPEKLAWEPALAFAYLTQNNSPQFLSYLNYWLQLRKLDGFQQQQYQYWLLAKLPTTEHHRWNIIDYFLNRL